MWVEGGGSLSLARRRLITPPLHTHAHAQAQVPTSKVLSHAPTAKATVKDSKVSWEGLGSAEPWTATPLKLHFHHNKPFKKVRRVLHAPACVLRVLACVDLLVCQRGRGFWQSIWSPLDALF